MVDGIPLWAFFGFLAAIFSATQMLLQEKFKTDALPMAFWSKVACGLVMIPFVVLYGLPKNLFYYELLVAQSLLWVVSDVIFYRGVSEDGAGMIARILPSATILSFLLWFMMDWPLARTYAAQPWHSAALLIILSLSAYCAWRLKKCHFTWKAMRRIWFVILASIVGALSTKFITKQVNIDQGIYAYVFLEAWIMVLMWFIYYWFRQPLPITKMFGRRAIQSGLSVGFVASLTITSTVYAVYHIDNPAYVSAVKYLDSVLILLFYRITSRQSNGNIKAGLGLVACAAALIVIKSYTLSAYK